MDEVALCVAKTEVSPRLGSRDENVLVCDEDWHPAQGKAQETSAQRSALDALLERGATQ